MWCGYIRACLPCLLFLPIFLYLVLGLNDIPYGLHSCHGLLFIILLQTDCLSIRDSDDQGSVDADGSSVTLFAVWSTRGVN